MLQTLRRILTKGEIQRLQTEIADLKAQNKRLGKVVVETREAAKHFDWNISHANETVKKFYEAVGLDKYGQVVK